MTGGLKTYLDSIRKTHHTDKYHSDGLIVRRGFSVQFPSTDDPTITLDLAPVHEQNRSELGPQFKVSPDSPQDGWSVTQEADSIHLNIPADAIVGAYAVSLGEHNGVMTVLFNPWCEEDSVYLANEEERDEYVLNDTGRIWVGSYKSKSGRPWAFAQFKSKSLLASLDLLDRMPWEERKDAVKVVRHLSAVVNSSDEAGMLTGNWSGDYSGGTSPLAWTGSAEIMSKFWDTQKSVQFGQCWVFSGVMTSVMRALGLASRSSTNFVSAHDSTKPYNRAVDKYYTANGDPLPDKSYDSIWNFHVWNEVWIARPDLKEMADQYGTSFDGWQAVDATPQEASHGLMQMGPAPLTAIKQGITCDYDVDFVIGEVNADVCHHWGQADNPDKFTLRSKHQRHVGRFVSTKAVGKDERHDITLDYKHPEGSQEEREALARRPNAEIEPENPVPEDQEDVVFKTEAPDDVATGETITLSIEAENKGEEPRTVIFHILARAVSYTGTAVGKIDAKEATETVEPGETAKLTIEVTPEEYKPFLSTGMPAIQFMNSGKVEDTDQAWVDEETIRFNSDTLLDLSTPKSAKLGETLEVQAIIKNTTAFPLTNSQLRIEGQGLAKLTIVPLDEITPMHTIKVNMKIKPVEVGDKLLIITLDTDELKDLVRSRHIEIEDAESGREAVNAVRSGFENRLEDLLGRFANLRA